MPSLLDLLDSYVFSGIPSSAAYDFIKAVWRKVTQKSWEDLYLDSFEVAVADERPFLESYSDGVIELPRDDLKRILHYELGAIVSELSFSELSSEQFTQRLADALAKSEILLLGGNTLRVQDYTNLISNIVQRAQKHFKQSVTQNPIAFQEAVVSELSHITSSVNALSSFLLERFEIVLPEIRVISEGIAQLDQKTDEINRSIQKLPGEFETILQKYLSPLTNEIKQQNLTVSVIDEKENNFKADEQIYSERIKIAINILKNNQPNSAKSQLEQVLSELEKRENVSSELMCNVLTHLGGCYLSLREYQSAAKFLNRALSHAPNDPKAITNAGVAAFVLNQYEAAKNLAEQALNQNPEIAIAISLVIDASFHLGKYNEVDDEILQKAEKFQESRRSLAMVLAEQGNLERAEQLQRQNVESSEVEIQDYVFLSQVIAGRVRQNRYKDVPVHWQDFDEQDKVHLQEAINIIDQVINTLRNKEDRSRYHDALALRAGLRGMMGEYDLSFADCKLILSEDAMNEGAIQNGGLAAFHLKKFAEAVEILERLGYSLEAKSSIVDLDTVRLVLAGSYVQGKQFQKAIDLLQDQCFEITDEEIKINKLQLLAEAALALENVELVEETINQLLKIDENSPFVIEAIGIIKLIQKEIEEAERLFLKAYSLSIGASKEYFAFRLGEYYYSQHNYKDAATFYGTANVPLLSESVTTRKYLLALLNAGEWGKAFEYSQQIRDNGEAIKGITDIEVRIAQFIDDLELASKLYESLIKIDPDNWENYWGATLVALRRDEPEKIISLLEPNIEKFSDTPEALIDVAKLLMRVNYPAEKVLSMAYKARRFGRNSAHVHINYFFLLLEVDKKSKIPDPIEVQVDTAVKLFSDGDERWYVILDDTNADKGKNELHINDPLAKKLIGLRKGDELVLTEHPIRQIKGEIRDLQSKYVRFVQETANNFSVDFPGEIGIVRVPISLNDPNKIAYIPIPNSDHIDSAIKLYTSGKAPFTLGSISKFINRNILEIWGMLSSSQDGKIKAATGTDQERRLQAKLASITNQITLEFTALLTLWELGYLEILVQRYSQIFVSQSLIDDLRNYIFEKKFLGKDGAKFMGVINGLPRFTEIPVEQVQQHIAKLEELVSWVQKNCILTPVYTILELGKEGFDKYEQVVGRQQLDSVLIAKQTKSVLFSDDLYLRQIAKGEFSVDGIWTQAVLNEFAERESINLDKYHEALFRLTLLQYQNVFVSETTLLYVLQSQEWHVTSQVERIFENLTGNYVSLKYASNKLALVLKKVWLGTLLLEQKIIILDLCLRVLIVERNPIKAIQNFVNNLRREFVVAPLHLDSIVENINLWVQAHIRL